MLEVLPEQHFTQPPPRFTEASLVKTLEELGIGRPSTYASIISTIQDRGYVRLEDRRFFPDDVGEVVTDKLVEHFPDIVDVNFTARDGGGARRDRRGRPRRACRSCAEFYGPFSEALERAEEKFERYVEDLDEECPRCIEEGRTPPGRLQKRLGRYGCFIGCSRFADEDGGCKYIRNLDGQERPEPEMLDETCPECGRPLAAPVRAVRTVRRLLRVPGVPLHQEGAAEVDRRRRARSARRARSWSGGRASGSFYGCDALPGLRLRGEPPADRRSPVPRVRFAARPAGPKSIRCWDAAPSSTTTSP